jgi:hypothetical protein
MQMAMVSPRETKQPANDGVRASKREEEEYAHSSAAMPMRLHWHVHIAQERKSAPSAYLESTGPGFLMGIVIRA